jgi:hypothetical protein
MTPQTQDPDALAERLARLERQFRLLKWGTIAGLALVVAWMVWLPANPPAAAPKAPSQDLDVQTVVLRDAAGNKRAVLAMLPLGPGLSLLDPDGQPRAVLAVGAEGPYLHLFDEDHKLRLALSAADRGANLSFYDDRGTPGAWMLLARGIPSLGLQGKSWSTLELHSVGDGVGLTMGSRKGPRTSRASLEFQGGWPSLQLLSEEGKTRTYRP